MAADDTGSFDYIVIGSGIAGLSTALTAVAHGSVLLITKGDLQDCNTQFAQGGIAAAVSPDDSPLEHLADTLAAGAGLVYEDAARVLTAEGPQRIAELVRRGLVFDTVDGQTALAREGAHSRARVLHAGGDATGAHIETTLAALMRGSRVRVLEHAIATAITVDAATGAAKGVDVLANGAPQHYEAANVVLATGGAGRLYRNTTNPEVATGDGVALAFRAGAEVMDMEFYQFHPTALCLPDAPRFLISEAVRGEGGILRNGDGEAFMARYHPMADLAPRDVVARAIVAEMRRSRADSVSLDVTHLRDKRMEARFPTIYQTCLRYGVDITRDVIPVAPAAHYMMGGVKTDTWGATTVPNLYACGEVACSGVNGANRLASNSLLEGLVFAHRIVDRTLHDDPGVVDMARPERRVPLRLPKGAADIRLRSLDPVQRVMWDQVGIERDAQGLEQAAHTLASWFTPNAEATARPSVELSNLALTGWLMAEAALRRTESRGAHYRTDHPETSPDWALHLVLAPSS
ncbi:MAG: L-aspartate oxidase [Dehalococcoidia bacterium]